MKAGELMECRRMDAGMSHQLPRHGPLLDLLYQSLRQFLDLRRELVDKSSRSWRRRLAYGANTNDSSSLRPAGGHSPFFRRMPSLSPTPCS